MINQREREAIRQEIGSVLDAHDTVPVNTKLSPEDVRTLHKIAIGIVQGDIDNEEVSKLNKLQADELSVMVQQLVGMKSNSSIRGLQEINPYYDAFRSKVVRDSWRTNP